MLYASCFCINTIPKSTDEWVTLPFVQISLQNLDYSPVATTRQAQLFEIILFKLLSFNFHTKKTRNFGFSCLVRRLLRITPTLSCKMYILLHITGRIYVWYEYCTCDMNIVLVRCRKKYVSQDKLVLSLNLRLTRFLLFPWMDLLLSRISHL